MKPTKLLGILALVMIMAGPVQAENPSLFEISLYAKDLGYKLVPIAELDNWTAAYPTEGVPVKWFQWRFDLMVPAGEIPIEVSGNFKTAIETYVPAALRDSLKVQLRSVGATGRVSAWTEWTYYNGSHRVPTIEVER